MKKFWLYITSMMLAISGSACEVQSAKGAPDSSNNGASLVAESPDEHSLLLWEGPALFAENPAECYRLRITAGNKVFTGPCDGVQTETPFAGDNAGGFTEILARFAPFTLNGPNEQLVFNGQGQISGPEWQRAVASWAKTTQAQLATGHVGAANNTVLAWNLGREANQCRMLVVLAYGYATAALNPCEGGQMQVLAKGWLDAADWSQFDTWLYSRASYYQENSYFDGRGTVEMSAAEANALAAWAEKVYTRLVSSTSQAGPAPTPKASAPVECSTPEANRQLWLDEVNGYCLLYPAN